VNQILTQDNGKLPNTVTWPLGWLKVVFRDNTL